jgi:hypothetical protein
MNKMIVGGSIMIGFLGNVGQCAWVDMLNYPLEDTHLSKRTQLYAKRAEAYCTEITSSLKQGKFLHVNDSFGVGMVVYTYKRST